MSSSSCSSAAPAAFDVNTVLQQAMGDVSALAASDKEALKTCGEVDVKLKHLFLRNVQLIDIFMALRETRSIELTDCIFEPGAEHVIDSLLRQHLPKLGTVRLSGRIFKENTLSVASASSSMQPNGRSLINVFKERVAGIKTAREFLHAEATGNSIIFQDILRRLVGSAETGETLSFQAYLEREGIFEKLIEEAPRYTKDSDVNLALRMSINAGELLPIQVPPQPPAPPAESAPAAPPAQSSGCIIA